MEDTDPSNDVVPLDKPIEDIGDQPIMGLFKSLISNDSKENTVLSNSQIINILRREFNVDMGELHELELDIYLGVLKKFLKHWPQWDEFEKVVNELKTKGDNDVINKLLEAKYIDLKKYLKAMLDVAKPMAKEALNGVLFNASLFTLVNEKKKNNDVVMEVHCSRSQLNNLFYKKPVPDQNDTLLNITDATPSKISLKVLPLKAILNWWYVDIHFDLKKLIFKRRTKHTLSHWLINTKLGNSRLDKTPLDLNFYMNKKSVLTSQISKDDIIETISRINKVTTDKSMKKVINIVLEMFLKDMQLAPEVLTVPAVYKRKWNKYPYVRFLYTDVENKTDDKSDKYDIQLQETVVPECEWTFFKVDILGKRQKICPPHMFMEVECKLCMVRFFGVSMEENLVNHFALYHMNEPNWKCVNCHGEFAMADLCENRWHHKC